MQQKIPIENLYYLLCYAWGVSDQLEMPFAGEPIVYGFAQRL